MQIWADVDLTATESLREQVGGKALGLVRMQALDLPVPTFSVIDASEWRKSGRFPDKARPSLEKALERLSFPLAVRSSAVAEDGAKFSFAGQLESVLEVPDVEACIEAISVCWKSGNSERVKAYCAHAGIEPGPVAVVLQELVPADSAGVMFTADPDGNPDDVLLSAAFGLGEGVVQGTADCDTYRVSPGGEVALEQHGAERVLLDEHCRRLARIGRDLDKALGGPQDIEFALRRNALYVLQVRPVTIRIPRGRKLLWDNSNIVESYSGVTTPLTFSFANRAYTIIYQLFCGVMGVDAGTIRKNEAIFHRMIGLVEGRVYYNLNAWYRVLTLLPGYQMNRAFMEQMMGVAEVANDEDAVAEAAGWQKALVYGPRVAWMSTKLMWRLGRLDGDVERFAQHFDTVVGNANRETLSKRTPFELLDIYSELERELLWAWTTPIVNDFFVMIFYGVLRKQCQKLTGDEDTNLHNELLAGQGDLESVGPTLDALRMAEKLRGEPELAALLNEDLDKALEHPSFARAWNRYMERWGDRCIDELKLETAPLRDTPEFLVATLQNYLRGEPQDPETFGAQEQKLRAKAENRASALGAGAMFRWILGQARRRVSDRERLRFLRTRIFGVVREIFRAFGDHFVASGALDERDEIWYLTVDEVHGLVRGTAVCTDLRGMAAVRRAEFDGYRAGRKPGERFYTRGSVHYGGNRFEGGQSAQIEDGKLYGTGVCPGVVEKEAKVLEDPRHGAELDGQILVAERTDPGWVPLYPCVSGLLIERGSLLSHSAVVAREMGLPTVVGMRGLLDFVQDGQRIRMDGDAGSVEVLDEAGDEE
jgi:rifampicin phosphotransferase